MSKCDPLAGKRNPPELVSHYIKSDDPKRVAQVIRGWLAEGVAWGDALARLHVRGDA